MPDLATPAKLSPTALISSAVGVVGLLIVMAVHSIRVAVIITQLQGQVMTLSQQQERRLELLEDAVDALRQTGTEGANRRLDMSERRLDRLESKVFNGGGK